MVVRRAGGHAEEIIELKNLFAGSDFGGEWCVASLPENRPNLQLRRAEGKLDVASPRLGVRFVDGDVNRVIL